MMKNKFSQILVELYKPYPTFESSKIDFNYIWKYVKMRYYNDRRIFSLLHID